MLRIIIQIIDFILIPFTFLSTVYLKFIRFAGIKNTLFSRKIFETLGIYPIRDHYYEPKFNYGKYESKSVNRELTGVDFNIEEQLELLSKFKFNDELMNLPLEKTDNSFYYHNNAFESGDAEYYYNIIRHFKPNRIIEIGSGFSTLLARKAIEKNIVDDALYVCELICVEPFEQKWLEDLNVTVYRKKAEEFTLEFYNSLGKNDILFIDSSHIINYKGDVLYEYLQIIPSLNSGVLIHVHDIFSPNDYPEKWIIDRLYFWNEQYLLEAFLSYNNQFKVIGALNYLKNNYFNQLAACCPVLSTEHEREPGSMWFQRK